MKAADKGIQMTDWAGMLQEIAGVIEEADVVDKVYTGVGNVSDTVRDLRVLGYYLKVDATPGFPFNRDDLPVFESAGKLLNIAMVKYSVGHNGEYHRCLDAAEGLAKVLINMHYGKSVEPVYRSAGMVRLSNAVLFHQ
jgi:hypothetical protein